MYYESTRGSMKEIESATAIKMGIASDGGLFVPSNIERISLDDIKKMSDMTYNQRAADILKYFLTDFTVEEITNCVNSAYTEVKFENAQIAPIVRLNEHVHVLELWHGPTCAFKDMALQILPHFMVESLIKTNETSEIVILVATSGDTGKAALEGFKNVKGTRVIVFFPKDGVSEVQRMQMITQEGDNVFTVAVDGNFDDAQTGVKNIFNDIKINTDLIENGLKFSSANSINWGRLVPQIVYYFSAYADLIKTSEIKLGDKINFVVPTGNFGNILAAYYAIQMGLPVNKLICASNDNNVLTEFINTGVYNSKREFKKTISPSMDILISSNLERLLYELTEKNHDSIIAWMKELSTNGLYTVDEDIKEKLSKLFWADFSTESETLKTIECIYKEYNYVIDTHTAVAIDVYDKYVISTGDVTKSVIVSTASPFKFNESVAKAILGSNKIEGKNEFELLDILSKECNISIPDGLNGLNDKPILHKTNCNKDKMKEKVKEILMIK